MKTPQEYRKKTQQHSLITLPSGLECLIQPVPTLILLGMIEEAEENKMELNDYLNANFTETLNKVLPSSVISPKIIPVLKPGDDHPEDALSVDEIILGDLNKLFAEIIRLSGISKQEVEEYQSFPEKSDRKSSGADSGSIQI